MYKMYTFSINTWNKIDVEAIKYNGEKWVNENYLEKVISYKNLTGNRTQQYSDELKKRDVKYKTVKIFNPAENLLQKN